MVQQPPGPPGGMQPPPPPPGMPPQAPMGRPRPQLDTSKLPIPDIVVAGGSLLALIFSFLHWYKVEIFGFGIGASGRGGYQNWPMIIYLLLLIFAGFFAANEMAGFVDINLPLGPIYLIWSIAGTFFTLLAFVIRPGDWDYVKMNWAIWIIMIIISLIPIVGGFMKVQQSS
ncbi:hypothetical protein [Candidatus Solincola tengchongensis]|uniref:hypothetical protein n=1 Tax=Candidatus Solincola tengchongensis TaxID=2900693 RepID=UPI00257BF6DB|nr:hypothetical protein [Candidatus Solincola tengchongensis]